MDPFLEIAGYNKAKKDLILKKFVFKYVQYFQSGN